MKISFNSILVRANLFFHYFRVFFCARLIKMLNSFEFNLFSVRNQFFFSIVPTKMTSWLRRTINKKKLILHSSSSLHFFFAALSVLYVKVVRFFSRTTLLAKLLILFVLLYLVSFSISFLFSFVLFLCSVEMRLMRLCCGFIFVVCLFLFFSFYFIQLNSSALII